MKNQMEIELKLKAMLLEAKTPSLNDGAIEYLTGAIMALQWVLGLRP